MNVDRGDRSYRCYRSYRLIPLTDNLIPIVEQLRDLLIKEVGLLREQVAVGEWSAVDADGETSGCYSCMDS